MIRYIVVSPKNEIVEEETIKELRLIEQMKALINIATSIQLNVENVGTK